MERYVTGGYVKMIAISIDDFESKIIDERNTNYIQDIETFQEKYGIMDNVKCMFLHMDGESCVEYKDYQKVISHVHPFDYVRDLIKSHNGHLLEESEDFTIHISSKTHKQKSIVDFASATDNTDKEN